MIASLGILIIWLATEIAGPDANFVWALQPFGLFSRLGFSAVWALQPFGLFSRLGHLDMKRGSLGMGALKHSPASAPPAAGANFETQA
jgi:hypothetical protein